MYKIWIYTIFRHSKSKQYRVTCCFCMEDSAVKVHYITQLTTHNYDYRRHVWDRHPYLHRKGLDYVWVQLFRQRIPCLYQYMKSVGGRNAGKNRRNAVETLKCRQEPSNKVDKNAAAIIRSDPRKKENIVGHVSQNISKTFSMFLKFPNT